MKTRRPQSNLAACLVPWTESFEFDVETFDRHCRYAIEEGYKDAYVFGTAGEGFAVGDRQFRDVVRRFARNLSADGMRPQVGVISLSMAHVIERIEFARGEGIRSFQISLPSWGALSD